MVKRKINQTAIRNRIQKLSDMAKEKNRVNVLFVDVMADGRLLLNKGAGMPISYHSNMFDVESAVNGMNGVTDQTSIFINDLDLTNELFLPVDPILYYASPEERESFMDTSQLEIWLKMYVDMIQKAAAISEDREGLPGFGDPVVKDLLGNCEEMTIGQLVERYKDQKWFCTK